MKLKKFSEVLFESQRYNKRHILLGNGFSVSCRPDIFLYGKLFEQADFSLLSSSAREAFICLETQDFERVIRSLRNTYRILNAYTEVTDAIKSRIKSDADSLREVLVQTIAKSHPSRPNDIKDCEYESCRSFLSNFNNIYTLNYDLLLYWTYMHKDKREIYSDDGFRKAFDDYESNYVIWESDQSYKQNIWFLHGALHIFDVGAEIRKFTWINTGIPLIEQIRDALKRDYYPLFVAEGTSEEKLERIRHSDYLAKAYRSFQSIQGALFIYGHSMDENDEHFLRLIEKGKIEHLYVGLYGDSKSDINKKIIRRARLVQSNRGHKKPLECTFFDSSTAKVWGNSLREG